jgi:hypothetical protein
MFMKKIIFFFLMWLATSCATVKTTADRYSKTSPPALSTGEGAAQSATAECTTPPVYLNGNDEPVAYGLFFAKDESASVVISYEHLVAPSPVERAGGEVYYTVACPVYYTGNNEPASSTGVVAYPDGHE